MPRKLPKGLAAALVIFLILIGSAALYWLQWMMPGNGFSAEIDSQLSAQGPAHPELATRLERILVEQRRQSAAPSLSAAISQEGGLLWAGAVGFASIERHFSHFECPLASD